MASVAMASTSAANNGGTGLDEINVQACLEAQKTKGNSAEYKNLLTQLNKLKDDLPAMVLSALAHSAGEIDETVHGELLRIIFSLSPWACREEVVACFGEFMISLVSANSRLLHLCLDWLVVNFLPPFMRIFFAWSEEVKELQSSRKEHVLTHVHLVLERLTDMVPTTPIHLLPILLLRMPHRRMDEGVLVLYLENVFRLVGQKRMGAVVRNQLLVAVVDVLIQIDVEISWEDILSLEQTRLAEEAAKAKAEEAKAVEAKAEEATTPAPADEKGQASKKPEKSPANAAQKLDSLMAATFEHVCQRIQNNQLEEVHDTLMTSFRTTILHANRSKFTQFLIFYSCSQGTVKSSGSFLSSVMSVMISTSEPPKTRVSAAAYLASFCARAKFLKLNAVCAVLQSLTKWLVTHVCDWEVEALNKPGTHMVFHAGLQALLYVLCYRMFWMEADPYARSVLHSLPLQQLLEHSSLHVLLPSVLGEFIFQATKLHVLDKSAVERIRQLSEATPSKSGPPVSDLDMFFPFDPYLLKTSARFIEDLYVDWPQVQDACSSYETRIIDGADSEREGEDSSLGCDPVFESMMDLDSQGDAGQSMLEEQQLPQEIAMLNESELSERATFYCLDSLTTATQYPLLHLPASLPSG